MSLLVSVNIPPQADFVDTGLDVIAAAGDLNPKIHILNSSAP